MIKKNFFQNTEYGYLKDIIVGSPFYFTEGEQINEAMRTYYGTKNAPKRKKLIKEYEELIKILKSYNVKTYRPISSKEIPQQLAPRDIGFVLGNTFIVSNMKWKSRRKEINAVEYIIKKFKGKILKPPSDVYVEGGNILIDNNRVFIGIGLRTNRKAVSFLKKIIGNKLEIIPIFLDDKEEITHLDAVLNLISDNTILIYPEGIKKIPKVLEQYKSIRLSKEEKNNGGCNVLSINKKTLIIRNDHDRLGGLLRKSGYQVYKVSWEETKKTGTVGPRCATLPLVRGWSKY